jgi:acetylornithine deacetylase/succinyl-diaminopimelate desuccinylase-like protein
MVESRDPHASPRSGARRPSLAGAALALLTLLLAAPLTAQAEPDWSAIERETLEHFQALLRIDTSNPPGNETRAVEYLKGVLEREGIPVQVFALDPQRANLVATLKGSGAKRPLLLMGHTDVVTAVPERWTHPPFAAVRDKGHVYGRGALDDKDNVAASLMVMLMLKRLNVPLDRDVIFLAEAGEESTTRPGIDFMTEQHWPAIAAEFCLAEGGGVSRRGGEVRFASIGTLEKLPRTVELIARGTSGHGSVPLLSNAVTRLSRAVAAVAAWEAPVRLNETTREYFRRLAEISSPEDAARFRDVLSGDPARVRAALEHFRQHSPAYAALLRTSVSPTILRAGDRGNVIPSEARATLDVRMLPDEDPEQMLALMREVIDDPSVEVRFAPRDGMPRPPGGTSIDTEAFRVLERAVTRHYDTVTLPTMSTGATDMAQVRSKGTHCYGIGPAVDAEDGPAGFGAHGDQERILESELHRFLRFYWDAVTELSADR